MPYTPPSTSPVMTTHTPSTRTDYINDPQRPVPTKSFSSAYTTAPNTPKSVQYLHKHKRSGSVSGTNEYSLSLSPSIRQSPAPVSDLSSANMPRGAVISPPESPLNSSDDEREQNKGGRLENLEELKKAVESISQARSGSASPDPEKSARKTERQQMRHTRSSSEPAFMVPKNTRIEDLESRAVSDTEDDVIRVAPPMVRKKSGEVVKSSLKPYHRQRPQSMPSTPTYPKVVHFDQHLEHVRHFSRSEKPTAVSAGSSPVECYELESEFPFGPAPRQPFEWEINLPNFPKDQTARKSLPVYVERVYLSADKQGLMGSIAVANIAFHKAVVVRFTLDYWRTTSEVSAEYNSDVRKKQKEDGYDRFNFCIRLDNVADLNNQTLFFCVRYTANGQDFWDNNNAMNFRVDFSKKMLGGPAKSTSKNSLPRSKPSQKKISIDDDKSDDEFAVTFRKPSSDRPKLAPKSLSSDDSTSVLPIRRSGAATNALGSRYSFGASLNAAIRETTPVVRDENRGKPLKLQTIVRPPQTQPQQPLQQQSLPVSKVIPQKPALPRMNSNEKPPIESLSYRELLDNYCFVSTQYTLFCYAN